MIARPHTTRAALATLALLAVAPTAARAFSELPRFAEPAVDGGGEGRYFTGAPPDGLSCSVCHDGGPTPAVTVEGLPDQVVAGTRYDLSLTWPDDGRRYALALELVDADGKHPAVTLPAAADQPAAMKCTTPAGGVAASTVDIGARRVVAVAPCGARALNLSFTPASDRTVYLGVGVVAADDKNDVAGDGVLELRRDLGAGSGGCNAGGASPGLLVALVALGVVGRPRRRRARASRPRSR